MGFLKLDLSGDTSTRLDGAAVYLRAPQPRDHEQWQAVRAASRDFLVPWEPSWVADELSRDAFRRRLRAYGDSLKAGTGFPQFIFRAADHQLIGGINLNNIVRGVAQSCSVGYWMGQTFARQGHMRDALRTLIAHGFGPLSLHRIEANCLPANTASIRLLESVGFSAEGHARAFLKINGVWEDHLRFAMVRGDIVF